MDTPTKTTSIADLLRDVLARAEAMDLAEALAILEIARATDANNIYLGALKRQLETMFASQRSGALTPAKKIELMESVPGIIECAVREHRRHPRPAADDTLRTESAVPSLSDQEAARELEALKLLYFQRASKFVMKGEYEQALAEVERVFIVDPHNSIARQYAQRVEQLIQHARSLAAAPATSSPGQVVPDASHENSASLMAHTAWTDEFLAPPVPMPEHRPAPTSSKQTIAYGTSLAAALPSHTASSDVAAILPRRRSTRWLAVAAVVLFAGAGTFALLTASSASTGAHTMASDAQTASNDLARQSAGTLGAQQTANDLPVQQQVTPSPQPSVDNGSAPGPSVTQKSSGAAAVKEPPPDTVPESRPVQVKKTEVVPAETVTQPDAAPVREPAPAAVEPAPAETPAFVPIEKQPEIVTLEKPQFSPFVWKTGVEAQVVIRVLIDTDGNPVDTQVLKSTSSVFEGPVIDAVMKSKFTPAQMGQGPVSAWLTIPFKMKQPK
jgi:protein TonB